MIIMIKFIGDFLLNNMTLIIKSIIDMVIDYVTCFFIIQAKINSIWEKKHQENKSTVFSFYILFKPKYYNVAVTWEPTAQIHHLLRLWRCHRVETINARSAKLQQHKILTMWCQKHMQLLEAKFLTALELGSLMPRWLEEKEEWWRRK